MGDVNGLSTLEVKTELMYRQAEELREAVDDMRRQFQSIEDIMNKTRNYWIGAAGDVHRQRYDEQKDSIAVMLERLYEHPKELPEIAHYYEEAERGNTSEIEQLSSNVIF